MCTTAGDKFVARLRKGANYAYLANDSEGYITVEDVLQASLFSSKESADIAINQQGYDGGGVDHKYALNFAVLEQSIYLKQLQSRPTSIRVTPSKTAGKRLEDASVRLSALQAKLAEIETPRCLGCAKTPDELFEYKYSAHAEGMTPTQFVLEYEGTYGRYETNKFYCTSCYLEVEARRMNGGIFA